MKHICAWCNRETAQPDGTADDDIISHGICDECRLVFLTDTLEEKHKNGRSKRTNIS